MITFACSQCGRKYQVPDDRAGKKAKCPCGGSTVVPGAAPIAVLAAALPVAVRSSPTEPPLSNALQRSISGILSAIFGGVALLFCAGGCLLYVAVWLSLHTHEKIGVLGGVSTEGTGKLLLPKVLNYASTLAAIGAVICGALSIAISRRRKQAIIGISLASAALVILLGFWGWTVSRKWEDYARDVYKDYPTPTKSTD